MDPALSFDPALLVMGVLSVCRDGEPDLAEQLSLRFGEIELVSSRWKFGWTDYYEREMGSGIDRYFLLFRTPVDPQDLPDIKLFTNDVEQQWAAAGGGRQFNLDPGLLTAHQLVLATTKNRAQRIALRRGIYGEVTLIFQKGGYQSLPWTYPDYRSGEYQEFFLAARRRVFSLLK